MALLQRLIHLEHRPDLGAALAESLANRALTVAQLGEKADALLLLERAESRLLELVVSEGRRELIARIAALRELRQRVAAASWGVKPTNWVVLPHMARALLGWDPCRALGKPDEAIAMAGLNPHPGENRLFGSEEADILAPEIEAARGRGINVTGPLPGDAVIPQAVRGKWNMVICCYHDQGHAPFKAVYGDEDVNITVGLPVVRVSVDHGTAFDIAGRGVAREASLILATQRAAALSQGWDAGWRTARAAGLAGQWASA